MWSMKAIRTPIMSIITTAILVIPIGISAFQQQQTYAPRQCPGCGPFLELTTQFERDVGQSILEFAVENHPNNVQAYAEFKKLIGQFKTDVINAVLVGNSDMKRILAELLETYQGKILDLRLGEEVVELVGRFFPFAPFSDF